MPLFNANITIETLEYLLFPLGPSHPLWLTISSHTNHLLRDRELCINSRSEGVDQLWPRLVPEPEHGCTIAAERALRGDFLLVGRAAVFDGRIFSTIKPSAARTRLLR